MGITKIIQIIMGSIVILLGVSSIILDQVWGYLILVIAVLLLGISSILNGMTRETFVQQDVPQITPTPPPQPVQKQIFKCKHCNKEFQDEKKLRRHIGMAHYDMISI